QSIVLDPQAGDVALEFLHCRGLERRQGLLWNRRLATLVKVGQSILLRRLHEGLKAEEKNQKAGHTGERHHRLERLLHFKTSSQRGVHSDSRWFVQVASIIAQALSPRQPG